MTKTKVVHLEGGGTVEMTITGEGLTGDEFCWKDEVLRQSGEALLSLGAALDPTENPDA